VALGEILQMLALVALAPGPAPPTAVFVDFDAPARCSDADAFYAGLVSRTSHIRRAGAGESAVQLKVRLARAGGKVHGELRIVGEQADSGTRRVDGASCEQVVEALSLTVALALDPTGAAASSGAAAPTAVSAPASAPAAAPPTTETPSPPSTAAAPPATTVAATPTSPASKPAKGASVASARAPAIEPVVAASPAAPRAASTSSPTSDAISVDVGARAVAANAASPYLGVGGELFVRIALPLANGATPSLAIAALRAPNDFLRSSDVVVRWTAVALTACPGWALRRAISLEACAHASSGWLTVEDRGITNPRPPVGRWSWNLGLAGRAWMPLSRRWLLDLELGLGIPLARRQFVTSTPERAVAETPRIAALLGLGLAAVF
jgi:hypothetical protein